MKQVRNSEQRKDLIIQLVGKVVAIRKVSENGKRYLHEYAHPNTTEAGGEIVPEIAIDMTSEDIFRERDFLARESAMQNQPHRAVKDEVWEITALLRKIVEAFVEQEILLFHGSAVAVDGRTYIFTAKSGTGKSTHTRLWREMLGERAVMVNDDKPFLEIKPDGVTAWGSPWMGKHRLGANIGVPLKAICILERGEENSIHPISAKEAIPMLFQQSARPQNPALLGKYMELVDRLATGVKFYRMQCTMSRDAARMAYEAMK